MTPPPSDQVQAQHPNLTKVTLKPVDLELSITPETSKAVEYSTTLHKTTVSSPKPPEVTPPPSDQVQAQHANLTGVTVKHVDLELPVTPEPTMEVAPSPTKQESHTQPLGLPKETEAQTPAFQEQTVLPTSKEQAQQSSLSSVTVQPSDLKLTVNPEPTTEIEHSTALQKTTAPPTHLQVTFPPSDEIQVQNPNLTTVTVKPVDLQLTIIPEHNTEVEPSPTKQESSTQPPESLQVVIPQLPIYHEVTVPPPGQNLSQHSNLPNVTVKSVDLEVTITSEPTSTTSSPELPQVAPPLLDLIQAQHPNLTEVTVKPGNLELTITPEPNMEAQPPPTKQDQVQHSNPHLPSVTLKPKDLEVTITPKPIMEVEHSTSLPGVELPPPSQVQTLHPNLTIVQPLDIEHSITQHPRSSEADTVSIYSIFIGAFYKLPPRTGMDRFTCATGTDFCCKLPPRTGKDRFTYATGTDCCCKLPPRTSKDRFTCATGTDCCCKLPPRTSKDRFTCATGTDCCCKLPSRSGTDGFNCAKATVSHPKKGVYRFNCATGTERHHDHQHM
ncbi:leucine-rich repeat-containing protein 37A3-like [Dasypus novemcinctus]|uniref:leucine-rich repeat-containing protein 37A3-like n=1 Tax=Dasypus novemcinctus TaxID=9361 RepID=UPI0039C91BCE